MTKLLGENWKDKVKAQIALKVKRVRLSDDHWIDFVSWTLYKTGYYAVGTINLHSKDALRHVASVSAPSKLLACLADVQLPGTESIYAGTSTVYVTREPLFGPKAAEFDESDSD